MWPDGSVSASYGFVHALYHEAVVERVPEGRLATWQRRIGERLELAFGAERAAVATELAMRFEAARDLPRAIDYLHTAAGAALARCAYREAVDLLQRALQLAQRLPPPQSAYFNPSWTAFQADRGRDFSVIVDDGDGAQVNF